MSSLFSNVLVLIVQIFTGFVPQGFLTLLFVYAVCRRRVDRQYIFAGLLLSVGIAFIRTFPIFKGSDIILNILCLICIGVFLCKMPVDKTIISSLIIAIILLAIELLLVAVYLQIFGSDFLESSKSNDALQWYLFGIPSSVILTPIVLLYYRRSKRKGVKNSGSADQKGSEQNSNFPEL